MRRYSLVIASVAALSLYAPMFAARGTGATSAHKGPVLAITFSGAALFLKTGTGYRVIVPNMRAHSHEPYVFYQFSDVQANSFKAKPKFNCGSTIEYQWAPLDADRLTLEPASALAPARFDASRIKGWLVHLKELAPNSQFNDTDYNQAEPKMGKVAAQMKVDRGTLEPLLLEIPYDPVRWEFKDGSATSNVKICGTSGIRWLVPLKEGTREISLVSARMEGNPKKHPTITLKVADRVTTEVVIGNSLLEDIQCPIKDPANYDPHFKVHYKMLKGPVPHEYVPVRLMPKEACPKPVSMEGNKSARGSDCLGSQWP